MTPDATPDEPIEVVGAAPAGLAAAITLARGGRRVMVREPVGRLTVRCAGPRIHRLATIRPEYGLIVCICTGLGCISTLRPTRNGHAFWHTIERRPHVPSCQTLLAYLTGRCAMNTALVVVGAEGGGIAYVDAGYNIIMGV